MKVNQVKVGNTLTHSATGVAVVVERIDRSNRVIFLEDEAQHLLGDCVVTEEGVAILPDFLWSGYEPERRTTLKLSDFELEETW